MSSTTLGFTGQKVVVIGGTSSMGYAVARHVLDADGTAVVTGRSQAGADEAAAALSTHGKAVGLAADLADPAAGVFAPKTFLEHTPEDYDRYQAINRAFFFLAQTVAANMIARGAKGSVRILPQACGSCGRCRVRSCGRRCL